jgi:hypothetical protein
VTKEQALELLAARAAMGPSKKSARRKSAPEAASRRKVSVADNGQPTREKPLRKSAKKKSPRRKPATAKKG